VSAVSSVHGAVPTPSIDKPVAIKILLVGNSFLRWNNLPNLIRDYFATVYPNTAVTVVSNIVDGRTVQAALDEGPSRDLLSQCDWDVAVVQGRTGLTWQFNGDTKWSSPESFVGTARLLRSTVKACRGEVALFAPWNFRSDREHHREDITYSLASRDAGLAQLPMGRVFSQLRTNGYNELIDPDGNHPGKVGSRAIAAAIAEFSVAKTFAGQHLERDITAKVVPDYRSPIVAALARTSGDSEAILRTEMRWDAYPTLKASKPRDTASLRGLWFAKSGATRNSYGTLLRIGEGRIEVTEFNVAGRTIRTAAPRPQGSDESRFSFRSMAVDFEFEVMRDGPQLAALSRSGAPDRLVFKTAAYEPATDNPYYQQLVRLYDRFDTEAVVHGLTHALPDHVARVNAFLAMQNVAPIAFDEWELILIAWHAFEHGEPQRGAQYLDAASALFPTSVDVKNERRKRGLNEPNK
jgi:hypothetical protein